MTSNTLLATVASSFVSPPHYPAEARSNSQTSTMADPLDADAHVVPPVLRHQLVLVDGRTFAISDEDGQMWAPTHGLVHDDLRHLSRLDVSLVEGPIEVLASTAPTPLSAVVVGRVHDGHESRQPGVVTTKRWVAGGLRQDVRLQNPSGSDRRWTLRIGLAADFAHVFDVKAGRAGRDLLPVAAGRGWTIAPDGPPGPLTRIDVRPAPDRTDPAAGALLWDLVVPPRSERTVTLTIEPVVDDVAAGLAFPCDVEPADAVPLRRLNGWRAELPTVTSLDPRLPAVVDQALSDLAGLRIFDRAHPERVVIAAGAPWFMTLFGRDSLLTAWMMLPFDGSLAGGVLRTLAELQGVVDDPTAEEQPGKILHELRRHGGGGPFASRERYYGTVDATPLFVMLAAEARRWGALAAPQVEQLAPAVDRALEWVLGAGDGDGDGFIDYQRRTGAGLSNQGWKDSWDGVTAADGSLPTAPIALVEVQGYAYAALLGAAELSASMRLSHTDGELRRRAAALRDRFNDRFWDPRGWYALALDGRGRAVDSLTTNPGHALWTGIAEPEHADAYLDRLMEADMWTGWGLRTLSSSMSAYDPLSYHNGSVWPHDTAICAAGAARYGRWDVVDRIVDGALDAATTFNGRPPELFAGMARSDAPSPVAYPSSCSPQAWASASVLLLVRAMLDLEPDEQAGLRVGRADLAAVRDLRLEGLRSAGKRFDVDVRDGTATVAVAGERGR
jgi:glycogen debranching enzyme